MSTTNSNTSTISNSSSQLIILTKLELCNIYGLNVLRFSRDKSAKRKSLSLLAIWILLLGMLIFYIGGLSYGLITINMQEVVPAYLIAVSSMLVFVFGMLKSGSVIFRREGYDMLCAMPLGRWAVVLSRLLRMYAENLLATLLLLLPGIGVYIWMIRPRPGFYGSLFLSIWFIPLIPMTGAVLIGVLITGISSRMRHKSLIAAGLSIVAVLGIFAGSSRLTAVEENITPEMLQELSEFVFRILGKFYPPAVWTGRAIVQGDLIRTLLCCGLSLALFTAVTAVVSLFFHRICSGLFGEYAGHNYELGRLKKKSVLSSLCRREFKRYFSSSIYVANTIIGPVMGCVLSGMLLAAGPESLQEILPFTFSPESIPFLIAGVMAMMTTTSVSISLEGKCWWIAKSLPLSAKEILDAKILMNLLLISPFFLVSEVLLTLALKPGIPELTGQLLIPAAIIVFSCVYGITVNLHFPVLNWESEVRVVKQSASALLGGMGGLLLAILCTLVIALAPGEYIAFVKAGIFILIFLITVFLYRKNNAMNRL